MSFNENYKEAVVKELPEIKSGYKTRIVMNGKGEKFIDIREYVESEKFTGFTKRGIRLDWSDVQSLMKIINEDILSELE